MPVTREVVLLVDTTYWTMSSGVMLLKDGITNENLLWYHVRSETTSLHREGVEELMYRGFVILGIVCDGRRRLITCVSVNRLFFILTVCGFKLLYIPTVPFSGKATATALDDTLAIARYMFYSHPRVNSKQDEKRHVLAYSCTADVDW